MNPRQRRGVILMLLACVGAVAVFAAVLSYVSNVRQEVGDLRTVLQLTQDVKANEHIPPEAIKTTRVPKRWLGGLFVTDLSQLSGKVAVKNLVKGEYLSDGMITDEPLLQPGQREIAIPIDAETGVAYKVNPGALVDVYATYAGDQQDEPSCARRVLTSVRVIDVGIAHNAQIDDKNDTGASTSGPVQVVPVTFALTPRQVLDLSLADSFATKVRLALIGPGSDAVPKPSQVCTAEQTTKRGTKP